MAILRRPERRQAGAPAWMVIYGDMVTLLLTFFVLMLAMSEVKKDQRFLDFMQAVRQAFGYTGGVQQTPLEDTQTPRNVNFTEMLILPVNAHDFSKARDPGVHGKQSATRDNRPAEVFVVGGPIQFAALSAELTESEAARIPQLARELRGLSTLLRVSGHCSPRPLDGTPFVSHFDLAYARARAVAAVLIEQGIDPQRIRIETAGINDPVTQQAYTEVEQLKNDLVEILQVDVRVAEPEP